MKYLLTFVVLLSSVKGIIGQNINLVPNSGFQHGQAGKSPLCTYHSNGRKYLIGKYIFQWTHCKPKSRFKSPDWMQNQCFSGSGTRPNFINPQSNRFVRLGSDGGGKGEAVAVELNYGLIPGKTYQIKMKLGHGNYKIYQEVDRISYSKITVHFGEEGKNWYYGKEGIDKWTRAISFEETPTKHFFQWTEYEGEITIPNTFSSGKLKQIILECTNENGGAVYVDDVELRIKYDGLCPEEKRIENIVYEDFLLSVFSIHRASKVIKAGFEIGNPPFGSGDVIVRPRANITYKAGEEIILAPGFHAQDGSTFHAFLAPCGRNCFPPEVDLKDDIQADCNNDCYELSNIEYPVYGSTYRWTASPEFAVDFLSDPNSPNPLMCIPSDFIDRVVFTLTVSNNCDESVSSSIQVHSKNFIKDISSGVFWKGKNIGIGLEDPNWSLKGVIDFNDPNPHLEMVDEPVYRVNPLSAWEAPLHGKGVWVSDKMNPDGTPIEYIGGVRHFYGIDFELNKSDYSHIEIQIDEVAVDNIMWLLFNSMDVVSGHTYKADDFRTTAGPYLFTYSEKLLDGHNQFIVAVHNFQRWIGWALTGKIIGYCNGEGSFKKEFEETLEEENTEINIKYFPNPTNDFLNIIINGSQEEGIISIYSIKGVKIMSKEIKGDLSSLNLTSLSNGMYFVKVNVKGKEFTEKFIKQ